MMVKCFTSVTIDTVHLFLTQNKPVKWQKVHQFVRLGQAIQDFKSSSIGGPPKGIGMSTVVENM